MPHTMQIFPNENLATPEVGDLFEVIEIKETTDIHWGACTQVALRPQTPPVIDLDAYIRCLREDEL